MRMRPGSLATTIDDLAARDEFVGYAARYAREHAESIDPVTFSLTDEEYAQFVTYMQDTDLKFSHRSTEVLKLLRHAVKGEGYADEAKDQLDALERIFARDIAAELEHFRRLVTTELENEIVLDVHLQRGAVKRIAFLNADVKRAVEILQNQEEYNQILGK